MHLPPSLKRYFWSCRFEELDTEKHKDAIIEQLLEYGNLDAWRWLLRTFNRNDVVERLRNTRILSPHSRTFWALYFHIDLPDDPTPGNATWRHRADH